MHTQHTTELISFQYYGIKLLKVPISYFVNKNKLLKNNINFGTVLNLHFSRIQKTAKNNLIEQH